MSHKTERCEWADRVAAREASEARLPSARREEPLEKRWLWTTPTIPIGSRHHPAG